MGAPVPYRDDTIASVAAQLGDDHGARRALADGVDSTVHLAVIGEPWWGWTLAGDRTVEARFMRARVAPYGVACAGDVVLLKRPGAEIGAVAHIADAEHVALRRPADLQRVRERYGASMRSDLIAGFWEAQEGARYASLVTLAAVTVLAHPTHITKRDARSWLVLRAPPVQLRLLGVDTR